MDLNKYYLERQSNAHYFPVLFLSSYSYWYIVFSNSFIFDLIQHKCKILDVLPCIFQNNSRLNNKYETHIIIKMKLYLIKITRSIF